MGLRECESAEKKNLNSNGKESVNSLAKMIEMERDPNNIY